MNDRAQDDPRNTSLPKRARAATKCRTYNPSGELQYQELVDSLEAVVWRRDPQTLRFTYVSRQAEALLGYPVGRWLNEPTFWEDAIHPQDRYLAVSVCVESIRHKRTDKFEYRMVAADGRIVWIRNSVRVIVDNDEPRELIGVMIDITETKRMEECLRTNEQRMAERGLPEEEWGRGEHRLRLIIDSIPTMAWTSRPDGTLDFVNRRWLDYTGLSLQEEIDEPARAVHPDDVPTVMEQWLANLATGGQPFEAEMRLRGADGVYRWFLVRNVPLRDQRGRIVKWFGTSTEINDRKQAEDALRSSFDELRALAAHLESIREEERTRVAREVHDELGQALTAIKLESASLLRELPRDARQQSNRAESVVKLAEETIQAVRRISSELRPGILDDLGLVAAVEWATQEFEHRTGTKCRLNLLQEDIEIGRERATALFRILQETLTNVARHAHATQVDVELANEHGSLILEVHDNGKGISQEQRSSGKSLGILGMRERVLLLGGQLAISGAPGQGTTVNVRIPGQS